MGCDIHIVLEWRPKDLTEWVGLWCSDNIPASGRPLIAQRDYTFFTEVAAVRGHSSTSVYPQNLPRDVSRLAWLRYMRAPTDHHSPSHMAIADFINAWLRANPSHDQVRREFTAFDLLAIDPDSAPGDYRVVFWFDN